MLIFFQTLGMENHAIIDGQITASSHSNAAYAAIHGRLQSPTAWSAGSADGNQWLQIDLGVRWTLVTGVATQGRNDTREWVTKYKLKHSNRPPKSGQKMPHNGWPEQVILTC